LHSIDESSRCANLVASVVSQTRDAEKQ